jgi:DNA-binding transcriptional ArsR family regulator
MTPFTALADPVRADIVVMLASADMPAGAIAERFAISRPAVSRHLRVLREAGLLTAREQATQRIYSLAIDRLDEIDAWVAQVRRRWSERLDRLGRRLDERAREQRGDRTDD